MFRSFFVNSVIVLLLVSCSQQRSYDVRYTGRVLAFNEQLPVQTKVWISCDEAGSAKSSARAGIPLGSSQTGVDGRFDFTTKGARSGLYWMGLDKMSELVKIQSNDKKRFEIGDFVLDRFEFNCNIKLHSSSGSSVRLISNLQQYPIMAAGKDTIILHRFVHSRNSFNLFTGRYPLMFETIKSNGQKITDTILIQINNTNILSHSLDY